MKVSVESLFGSGIEEIQVDQSLRLSGDLGARYPGGMRVFATIRRISHGVYVDGWVEGTERETCGRCLEPFSRPARVRIEEPFSEDVPPAQALFSDVAPLVGRQIDLDELVGQLLEVDEPLVPLCRAQCAGICQWCGANRNVEQCSCRQDVVDPRLAGLARLLQEQPPD
ncbi:MAG: DUF177 domain-containing protein [Candidatus Eremiobacteraeota bacterium]|nr:DUF177 domain-containing protein [Candidatus Eremiobacteraeota bacterium]